MGSKVSLLLGNNVDANFSTTEIVSYNKKGSLKLNGLNAKFAFAAECEGTVMVNLTNAFSEVARQSEFDIYVDGVYTETKKLDFGTHSLVLAEDLPLDTHEFMIVKKSGGDLVSINKVYVKGTLTTPPELADENAVDVVVSAPISGQDYGHVNVYVRTTDASKNYYINYFFEYDVDAADPNAAYPGKVNAHSNNKLYRVQEAYLVEKTGDYSYNSKFEVLRAGEISYATTEIYNGQKANDFVGGWHGDENIEIGRAHV